MKYTILVVDDDPGFRKVVCTTFDGERFEVREAEDGEEAWRSIRESEPDLVLADYEMPRVNGIELVRRLRRHPMLCHVPVVMLTAHGSGEAIVAGLEAGADDYVVKPFQPDELEMRVLAQLRRRDRDLESDALTRLPSGDSIARAIERRITANLPFAAIYADLDHFKPYVDRFGFLRAGSVILRAAEFFLSSMREVAGEEAFVGHIAGDDFIALCMADSAEPACRALTEEFGALLPELYPAEDLERGYLEGLDRGGMSRRFPLLSISLCLVDSREHELREPEDVARLAFGVRQEAKSREGSAFVRA